MLPGFFKQHFSSSRLKRVRDFVFAEQAVLIAIGIAAALVFAFLEVADEVSDGETHEIDIAILEIFRVPGDPNQMIGSFQFQEAVRDIPALGSDDRRFQRRDLSAAHTPCGCGGPRCRRGHQRRVAFRSAQGIFRPAQARILGGGGGIVGQFSQRALDDLRRNLSHARRAAGETIGAMAGKDILLRRRHRSDDTGRHLPCPSGRSLPERRCRRLGAGGSMGPRSNRSRLPASPPGCRLTLLPSFTGKSTVFANPVRRLLAVCLHAN